MSDVRCTGSSVFVSPVASRCRHPSESTAGIGPSRFQRRPGFRRSRFQGPLIEPGNSIASSRVNSVGLSQFGCAVHPVPSLLLKSPVAVQLSESGREKFQSKLSACNADVSPIASPIASPKFRVIDNAERQKSSRHFARRRTVDGRVQSGGTSQTNTRNLQTVGVTRNRSSAFTASFISRQGRASNHQRSF